MDSSGWGLNVESASEGVDEGMVGFNERLFWMESRRVYTINHWVAIRLDELGKSGG